MAHENQNGVTAPRIGLHLPDPKVSQHIETNTKMKIEFRTIETPLYSREQVIGLLKDNPKFFEGGEIPSVEILLDEEVVYRTRKIAKVQKMFGALLEDLKKIKE